MKSSRNHPDLIDNAVPSGAIETSRKRSIPSLDGLRAFSVGLVIASHYVPPGTTTPLADQYLYFWGQTGVNMFFVISGFLITFLLVKEQSETSTISLKRFYARRALRIFPPFYWYLAVAAVLSAIGVFNTSPRQFAISGLYLWNYYMPQAGSILGHTWSLALEEQFYLFWPAFLKLLKPRRALYLAVALILIEPVVRVAIFLTMPELRQSGKISAMFHTRIDTIMFGCLIGLLWRHDKFKELSSRFITGPVFYMSSLFVIGISPALNIKFRLTYHAFWLSVESLALSLILIYLVHRPTSAAGTVVNFRIVRFVGVLSYSLYLWQQLFTRAWLGLFPLNLVAAFACALLSFYVVERPALRLRDALGI